MMPFTPCGKTILRQLLLFRAAAFLLVLSGLTNHAKAGQYGDFTYQIDGNAITLTAYAGYVGEVTIPGKIGELPVTVIGPKVFYQKGISAITIPDSVTSIGDRTFQDCTGLTSITLPGSISTIGGSAFAGCYRLTSITLPGSLTTIGGYAFAGCGGLTSITIPGNVTSIGEGVFFDCPGLTSISIPESVTIIGDRAFSFCKSLTSITIPESVTTMGKEAFSDCAGLTSIIIPKSVTSIESYAFSGCSSLISVTIPEGVTSIHGVFHSCTGLTSVIIPASVTSIGEQAFLGCRGLISVNIPENVASIGKEAFFGCAGLTSIIIPKKITSIAERLFSGCHALNNVSIPENIISIGPHAFSSCESLSSLAIPGSVTTIGGFAFYGCESLTRLVIPGSVTTIEYGAFSDCAGLTSLVIPGSITSIEYGAFSGCAGLTSLVIPGSITSIGYAVFSGCTGLTSLVIPGSITSIGYAAFSGCTGLTSIVLPNSLISIGDYAFHKGTALTRVTIPDSVTSIGSHAFSACLNLTGITIPESVTAIGEGAFSGCLNLTGITIPESVTAIGEGAFSGCTGLNSITILQGAASIGNLAFSGCTGLTSITILQGAVSIGNQAFSGCTGLTSVIIPGSVTFIGDQAFANCTALTSVTISKGVISIGSYAFRGSMLATLTIPDSVTSIGAGAFSGCTGLTSLALSGSLSSIGSQAFSNCTGLISVTMSGSFSSIGSQAFFGCHKLMTVIFTGSAPSVGSNAFRETSPAFTVIAAPGSAKFTFPNWSDYRSVQLRSSDQPLVLLRDTTILGRDDACHFSPEPVGGTMVRRLVILNTSGVPQPLSASLSASGSPAFGLDASALSVPLAPGASVGLTVSFRPAVMGPASTSLEIAGSGPEPVTYRLALTGDGVSSQPVTQSAYLKASAVRSGEMFGTAIAISGNTVVVSAPDQSSLYPKSGAVYVFLKTDSGWSQEARLLPSNPDNDDLFGSSVAIDGDTMVVGARKEDSAATGVNGDQSSNAVVNSGAAYVFTRSGGIWTPQAYLKASKSVAETGFGNAVSISGDTIAVGAFREHSSSKGINGTESGAGASSSGAVYLFTRTGGSWKQDAYLKPSNTDTADGFGGAVSLSGETVVVGAAGEDSSANGVNGIQTNNSRENAGAAYVFTRTGGVWSQQAYLKASITGVEDLFGSSVSISGDTIMVGIPGDDSGSEEINGDQTDNSAPGSGAACIFIRTGDSWSQQAWFKTAASTRFGGAVCLSGDIAVVGADQEDSFPRSASGPLGAAHVFQRTGSTWMKQAHLKASNADHGDLLGISAVISGNTIAIGAPGESSSATGVDGNQSDNRQSKAGAAYLFEIGLNPAAPAFTLQPPPSQVAAYGKLATLSVGVSGIPAPLFQWYRGLSGDTSKPVSGANGKTLSMSFFSEFTNFWVRATNSQGTADSATASVTVIFSPVEQWRLLHF